MCGRVRLTQLHPEFVRQLGAEVRGAIPSSTNIKPTTPVCVLIDESGKRVLEPMQWGLIPAWAKDKKIGSRMFNARAETIAEKPSFRAAFQNRRCGIVVDAFYEWAEVDGVRVPHAFRVVGQANFTLAGIWAEWRDPNGIVVRTCSIVTCAANEQMRPYHDRMPVILDPPALEAWIDPRAPPERVQLLMVPYAGRLSVERATL